MLYRYTMNRLFFSMLFTAIANTLTAQDIMDQSFDGRVLYHITFTKDSTNHDLRTEVAELLYSKDNESSIFRTVNQGKKDSILQKQESEGNFERLSFDLIPIIGTSFTVQVLKVRDSIYTFDGISLEFKGTFYRYAEPMDLMNWTLSEETKEIAGYLCQRADTEFGGRMWTAWFAPEIPLTIGPYKFFGLPSLILSARDHTGTWQMEFLGINDRYAKEVRLHRHVKNPRIPIDKVKFFETKKHVRDNGFLLYLAQYKDAYEAGSEDKKKAIRLSYEERARKDNNRIELYP